MKRDPVGRERIDPATVDIDWPDPASRLPDELPLPTTVGHKYKAVIAVYFTSPRTCVAIGLNVYPHSFA
ncbi:hypothetical protein [Mycobacterium szulgai]|uniref:Uncharacterized protein n=1 Tax=Mycobacterium szulgai TaxID=1787 RepID=A0A1X2EIN0_MYCSZ|nr:hypothetical protein [Mycobacterium szulgai]MCV7078463.1 hypothetical protein [Mycobacterium szulgai]ORX03224.1 hypothetical protein AWC27_28075 [Mycobacterium szulgai]